MRIEEGWEQIRPNPESVLTVGTFDGVHLGHAAIIQFLNQRARMVQGVSTVVTFDPHPREVLTEQPQGLLSTIPERAAYLEQLGLNRMVVVPFTREFAETPPEEYIRRYLVGKIGLKALVIGHDHRFGRGREGGFSLLRHKGSDFGFETYEIPAQMVADEVVSSTVIRRYLEKGQVAEAARLLGRPYEVRGLVVTGRKLGRTIGFPTANVFIEHPRKILPVNGSYAVTATLANGAYFQGMAYIGRRPSIEPNGERGLEVNLFNFSGNLYQQTIKVHFHAFIRPDKRFGNLVLLQEALKKDEVDCKAYFLSLS
ncbi:MAG TPA: riboflavin biosynthesis protein RibF [Rhodothermales bacterium]|nr:riboflavin biosynthesis protein RibF [Rhodothermales bacterium]